MQVLERDLFRVEAEEEQQPAEELVPAVATEAPEQDAQLAAQGPVPELEEPAEPAITRSK